MGDIGSSNSTENKSLRSTSAALEKPEILFKTNTFPPVITVLIKDDQRVHTAVHGFGTRKSQRRLEDANAILNQFSCPTSSETRYSH